MSYGNEDLYEGVPQRQFVNDKEREITKLEDEKTPVFTKSDETCNYLEGEFKKVEWQIIEYEKQGKQKSMKVVRIFLEDKGTEIILKLLPSIFTRTILNTLVSQSILGRLKIKIGLNKKGFATCFILNDGIFMEWNFSYDEQLEMARKITDPETGEVIKTVYDKYEEKLEELSKTIQPREDEKFQESRDKSESREEHTDDLPF